MDTAPRRRLTPAEAPTCRTCGTRYRARNTYPTHTRYQRACECKEATFALYRLRPIDITKLDQLDRVRLGL